MQDEEVVLQSPAMTFNETIRDSFSPKPTTSFISGENKTLFDGVNLEDDIEKVEISTPSSTSSSDFGETDPLFSPIPNVPETEESIKNFWLQKLSDFQKKLNHDTHIEVPSKPTVPSSTPPSRVIKYQDLPYMGEMTLDNSKPRRGRKPKKADICHLIYKNYGTIFPGTPNPKSYLETGKAVTDNDCEIAASNRSNVQNKIISSLLEKRLTQESNNKKVEIKKAQNEPLNLCIRDLNHLKIRLMKKTDNTYTSEIKSEPQSDDDIEFIQETPSVQLPIEATSLEGTKGGSNGFVYWPNGGVFIHPMALQQQLAYYQKMASNPPQNQHSLRFPPKTPDLSRKLVPKSSTTVSQSYKKPSVITNNQIDPLSALVPEMKAKRVSTSSGDKTPTKRKRSAIFIPPIPTETNSNPATEVSICKFKFTGGAKPSLQEKKMLSVDSGGNFRYYSGTGDKSMRGYEFFPRETLQQQINSSAGSSTGAFLQASGEKIYPITPVDFTGNKTNTDFLLNKTETAETSDGRGGGSKKRKSRKSLQREKLEQTFKEKGFLIQTQQLESAEGATYCKFRQLRKFTRYLFRSWKDYLPGNVRELQEGEKIEGGEELEVLGEPEIDNLSRHSSEISSHNGGV